MLVEFADSFYVWLTENILSTANRSIKQEEIVITFFSRKIKWASSSYKVQVYTINRVMQEVIQ